MTGTTRRLRFLLLVYTGAVSLASAGCMEPAAQVRVVQPQLEGWQENIQLLSDRVYWAPGTLRDRLLAEFPLPGATEGETVFLLYLRWPSGQESFTIKTGPNILPPGFLIQTRGEHAGLALVTRGTVTVRGSSKGRQARRRVNVDLVCEDGTQLKGELTARRNDWELEQFETRRRPADVAVLEPAFEPESEPSGEAEGP